MTSRAWAIPDRQGITMARNKLNVCTMRPFSRLGLHGMMLSGLSVARETVGRICGIEAFVYAPSASVATVTNDR